MCKLLLHCLPSTSVTVQLKMWMGFGRIRLFSMQAAPIEGKLKHTDVYHQNINYNCLYLLHYTYSKYYNQ
jgi:hypothetical protein